MRQYKDGVGSQVKFAGAEEEDAGQGLQIGIADGLWIRRPGISTAACIQGCREILAKSGRPTGTARMKLEYQGRGQKQRECAC